jgi:4-hydroxy-3-methylbut-2-en-1-yl diphosphate synthase IspG/GcpE
MNRYGDTPRGMVESALEFLDVCEAEGFFDVVFSMKASNPQVAIQAYRLLAASLDERASRGKPGDYPFHVGVTEAGDGEDGRIKSAIGIGSLLTDGFGDTIRVSLTEDPVKEVPVARAIAARVAQSWRVVDGRAHGEPGAAFVLDPYEHERRASAEVASGAVALGGRQLVRAELELGAPPPTRKRLRGSSATRSARAARSRARDSGSTSRTKRRSRASRPSRRRSRDTASPRRSRCGWERAWRRRRRGSRRAGSCRSRSTPMPRCSPRWRAPP